MNGIDLVDGLNALSLTYSYLDSDTATHYQQKALDEAKRIAYARGEAISLSNRARIAGHLRNFSEQEGIYRGIVEQYAGLKDQQVIEDAYLGLALALFCQSRFEEATEFCVKARELSESFGDTRRVAEALGILGSISFERGEYRQAFESFGSSLSLFQSIHDGYNTAIVLAKIGDLYRLAGDHNTALNFYHQSLQHRRGMTTYWRPLVDLGDAYYSLDPADSVSNRDTYLHTIKSLTIRTSNIPYARIRNAEKLIASKSFDYAIGILTEELGDAEKRGDTNYAMRVQLDLSRAYEGNRQLSLARRYAHKLLGTATRSNAKPYIRDAYRLLYTISDKSAKPDSGYYYYRQFTAIKDSVALDDFSKRLAIHMSTLANEKAQVEIELLNREKQISDQKLEINQQQLQSESMQKKMLVAVLGLLLVMAFVLFRNIQLSRRNETNRRELAEKALTVQKLENERTNQAWQQRALELEMQSLRSQMNPHFLFNSLNSINRFILQNDQQQASTYLTTFSRLIRLILQNSQFSLITLENELEALQLYLALEAARFERHFEYRLDIQHDLDVSAIKVPPLIIQPYAENAIWHGLMHKESRGLLVIAVSEVDDQLLVKITDNGIGRKKAAALKSKSAAEHKSLGMRITADRIAMLQREGKTKAQVTIRDLELDGAAAGTEVHIRIPICHD